MARSAHAHAEAPAIPAPSMPTIVRKKRRLSLVPGADGDVAVVTPPAAAKDES